MASAVVPEEVVQTWSFRGSKSRNKVSVGEPAEGSLTNSTKQHTCEPVGASRQLYACNCSRTKDVINTTFNNGSLGSRNDEERSELR